MGLSATVSWSTASGRCEPTAARAKTTAFSRGKWRMVPSYANRSRNFSLFVLSSTEPCDRPTSFGVGTEYMNNIRILPQECLSDGAVFTASLARFAARNRGHRLSLRGFGLSLSGITALFGEAELLAAGPSLPVSDSTLSSDTVPCDLGGCACRIAESGCRLATHLPTGKPSLFEVNWFERP